MRNFTVFLLVAFSLPVVAQHHFTRQDTLRGSITPERSWWDLTYYHLDIKVNPFDSTIVGSNTINYSVLKEHKTIQIDLQLPLRIDSVVQSGKVLKAVREINAWFIELEEVQSVDDAKSLKVYYSGKPRVARHPPWDGGLVWKKDESGLPFAATACQGIGASVWWPCKDHMYDEPDSMAISVNVPNPLINVSNGRLRKVEPLNNQTTTYHWFVSNPINNYGVNINIADYAHFSEVFEGENGPLTCDYYVLKNNLQKAKKHFEEVPRTLKAFEHWFGPYPFYNDGYKLVEASYPGMEHQSSVTYGNGYIKGYQGVDISGSGWGLKYDYIIVHETGHEWFANNITYKDAADMWIHEGFTAYSECLFVEYYYGKNAGAEFVRGTRKSIQNNLPVIGRYHLNNEGSGDMYYKGANLLHTLRQLDNDDEKWRQLLRGLNRDFFHQTVTTQQIEDYISKALEMNLTPVFNQYLRDVRIPEFQYFWDGEVLNYRWFHVVSGFAMPVVIQIEKEYLKVTPTAEWQQIKSSSAGAVVKVNENYYVLTKKVKAPE
jgi:aminopeptidase N